MLKLKSNENTPILCENRFEPLMGSESMFEDFGTLDFEIHVGDAVIGDAEQRMDYLEVKSTQNCDKFDKALAK